MWTMQCSKHITYSVNSLRSARISVCPQLVVVSVRPWNGGAEGVAPTLELLNSILEDVQSPAHGKVGSIHAYSTHMISDSPERLW